MYVFTTRALDFVYTTVGRVKFVYFFRISPVKLKFSMITVNDWSFVNLTIFIQSYKQNIFLHLRYTIDAVNQGNWSLSIK